MPEVHKFTVSIRKGSKNRTDPERLNSQIKHIKLRAFNASRVKAGWTGKVMESNLDKPKIINGEFVYKVQFSVICKPARSRDPNVVERQYEEIVDAIDKAGKSQGWEVSVNKDSQKSAAKAQEYAKAEIPEEWTQHFQHLYEREDQIEIVLSSIQAAIKSNFQDRFHVCLAGPAACGKTEILRGVRSMLGNDAVLEYDATATTMAGAIKDLAERAEVPRILLIEEMEKVDENSLRWLLGILDHRAEIRKVNFKQQIHKEVRMLCLCTVNDYDLFTDMMYGALASRFPNHVYCPRPGRKVLEQILKREVERVKGREKWITPTLDYAEKHGITDPRRVISICLCGRNQLLTGEYQKRLDRTDVSRFHKKTQLRGGLMKDDAAYDKSKARELVNKTKKGKVR